MGWIRGGVIHRPHLFGNKSKKLNKIKSSWQLNGKLRPEQRQKEEVIDSQFINSFKIYHLLISRYLVVGNNLHTYI